MKIRVAIELCQFPPNIKALRGKGVSEGLRALKKMAAQLSVAYWTGLVASVCTVAVLTFACVAAEVESEHGLFFVASSGNGWQLYWWDRVSRPRGLTSVRSDAGGPAPSPDYAKLAYTSEGGLWIVDVKSGVTRQVAARFPNGSYGHPNWISSDLLSYTLYTITPPTEDSDIYAHSLRDGRQRVVVRQTGSQDYPAVSLDGNKIAYMSSVTTTVVGLGTQITQQLWVADLRTGKVEQVTVGGSRDTRPAWSPDGKRIAFSSDRDGNPEIWIVDLESRMHTKVTKGKGEKTDPCWSPDGKQVLYVTTATGKRALEIMDLASGVAKPVRPFGNKDVEIRDPAWGR